MSGISRREFVATVGAVAGASMMAQQSKAAPSETVRHATIGLGGQGRGHARTFHGLPDCQVVAVCDVDPERRAKALSELEGDVTAYDDFRRILDDDSIDSVSIATPDHWHTPIALWAIEAGKHVYVEKPCSHNMVEGMRLVEAQKKSGLCMQHGTQGRSGPGFVAGVQYMREGNLGKIRFAKAINHQLRGPIGRAEEKDPPEGVDYDMWLGPAPVRPFTQNRWHYNWHWHWDYGTGDMGNDGIHQVDEARWGLGVELPNAVNASGGQLFYDDDHETPDTQTVTFEYDDCYLMYEMRLWTKYPLEGHDNGVVFYGDDGKLEMGRHGCFVTKIGEEPVKLGDGADFGGHIANFVACVKDNNPDGLNAHIREGALSAALCHLGNIGTRVSERLIIDPKTGECTNSEKARALYTRDYRDGYGLPPV